MSNRSELTTKDIYEVLACIRGIGYGGMKGIHTYPGCGDRQDKLHAACEALEKRRLIVRQVNTKNHAFFVEAPKKRSKK